MVITYHGGQCFKVSCGDTTLAFDPIAKQSKLKPVKFGADIAFISLPHPNFNGLDNVASRAKQPFVIAGPGEYEVGEVTTRGWGVPTVYDKAERYNTVYQVTLEGINLVFLGALGTAALTSDILGAWGDIDVLFVPIGGGDVLNVPEASKLATKLEAKVIIPMHYTTKDLKAFLKEEGSEAKPKDKLTIKKRDLVSASGEIVVLQS